MRFFLGCGFVALLTLAGCGRSGMWQGERAAWRGQAEAQCMQSGAVKLTSSVVRIEPIDGPGVCGAQFPLKVAALGESSMAMSYGEAPRPPGRVGNASMPDWPTSRPAPQPASSNSNYLPPPDNGQMRWVPGAQPVNPPPQQYNQPPQYNQPQYNEPPRTGAPQYNSPQYQNAPQLSAPQTYQPRGYQPQSAPSNGGNGPMSIYAPGVDAPETDDVPDDAETPDGRPLYGQQPSYNAPRPAPPQSYNPPPLGPSRDNRFGPQQTGSIAPANLTPAATLSCPIVSALDRWVATGVQPAAMRWFGQPVSEIRQISAYSCRGMNGSGGHGISEHAFGNALDIAAFTLSDGRKIVIKNAWRRGSPEEQGFLHDVQLAACDMFNTVLAPGYNAAHYDHIHVDLMRRKSGRRPCRPDAIPGEVVAAKARAMYAARNGGKEYTGSIGGKDAGTTDKEKLKKLIDAIPGADGLDDEDADDMVTGSIGDDAGLPAPKPRGWPIALPPRAASTTSRGPADF